MARTWKSTVSLLVLVFLEVTKIYAKNSMLKLIWEKSRMRSSARANAWVRPPRGSLGHPSVYAGSESYYKVGVSTEAIAGSKFKLVIHENNKKETIMKFFQVTVMIVLVPILNREAQAAVLTKNAAAACLGEEVIFTCTLPVGVYSLAWSLLITRNPDIPVLRHTFFYGDFEVHSDRTANWRNDNAGFYVKLELVAIEPVLVSTLATNLTGITVGAEVTCAQSPSMSQPPSDHITLASIPSVPVDIIETVYKYGCTSYNISLSWTLPINHNHRIDNYQLRTIIGNQLFSVVLNELNTSFTINTLSYFETIIVELAIVNCAGVGAESNITVFKGGCFEQETQNSSEYSCMKPAGYQTIIECDPGEFPEEIVSTCQENGSWIQNSTGCSVGCQIPALQHDVYVTAITTHNGVHFDVLTKITGLGSEIQLSCKNGTHQDGASAVFRAVCQESGMWSPDLSEHKCTDQPIQIWRHYMIQVITGASAGCGMALFLITCGLFCITRRCTRRRHNIERTHLGELYPNSALQCKVDKFNQDLDMCTPEYDTIVPIYDTIPDSLHHPQNSLKMMNNDAYAKNVKYTL